MVVGDGLIASAFKPDYQYDNRYVVFASGVSNSAETDEHEFLKEEYLLRRTLKENKYKHFIYFTSFICFKQYGSHKLKMEGIIKSSGVAYTIINLPQVIGNGGNANNLFNYMVNNIKNDKQINIYDNTYRSLIDVEDIKRVVDLIQDKYAYVPFFYVEKLQVADIVDLISKALGKTPVINFIDSPGFNLPGKTPLVNYIIHALNIIPKGYTERIINKYVR